VSRRLAQFAAAAVAGAAVVWAGAELGLWWTALAYGLVIGALLGRARTALPAALAAGVLGWGLPLLWLARTAPVGATAVALSQVLGLGAASGAAPIALTLATGGLLGLCGAWLGSAARRLTASPD
jgi:hypothetical protein